MKYTYLLIDFFTLIFPLIFSFHPKLNFYKTWPAFFPAVIISGLIFLVWDSNFTRLGVWGFNSTYITGLHIANLPVEEILFFFCVPYACVFTCFCLSILIEKRISQTAGNWITGSLLMVFVITAALNTSRLYTSYTFFFAALLLILTAYILKAKWLKEFYPAYLLLLIPFFIVNGLLTGTGLSSPVVWYNNNQNINFRLLTIPFEDIFYGMDLILLNLLIYTYLLKKTGRVIF